MQRGRSVSSLTVTLPVGAHVTAEAVGQNDQKPWGARSRRTRTTSPVPTGEELRLGFVQELHRLAARPTDDLADDLLGQLERVAEGDLVCPTTPAVWRVDLAASQRDLGRTAEAARLVEELLPTATSTYDLTLHSRLRREFPPWPNRSPTRRATPERAESRPEGMLSW